MRIAICDDEKEFTKNFAVIINHLHKSLDMIVDEFSNGNQLVNSFLTKPYDIVFLDIEMPEIDGISLARQLRKLSDDVSIVFLTGHKEYAIDGYGLNALRYLVKPVMEKEIHEILEHVLEKQNSKKFIWLTNRDGTHRIKISDIIFIEAKNQNLIFYTVSGSIEIRGNINKYEKELESDGFFRVHRSYIVSLSKIKSIFGNKITVECDFKVPIARAREHEFNHAFFLFINKEAF
ncbi:MAG: LytTR family DNA-binding domain-containing protein [Oscillospiraceae bacterium]|nr:response regulator transcription factor [Ruminococcus sp.]MDE6706633.1 LytTR family DNA-binding domain-containing protein [Oscillospiraceae bacterium]